MDCFAKLTFLPAGRYYVGETGHAPSPFIPVVGGSAITGPPQIRLPRGIYTDNEKHAYDITSGISVVRVSPGYRLPAEAEGAARVFDFARPIECCCEDHNGGYLRITELGDGNVVSIDLGA